MNPRRPHLAVVALGGRGGSSIAALEVAAAMSRSADVTVLAPRAIERRLRAPLRRLDGALGPGRLGQRLERLHRERPLDALHVHYLGPHLPECLAAVGAGPGPRPAVTAVAHGSDVAVDDGSSWRSEGLPAAVDRWVAPSRALAAQAGARHPQTAFECIPNGVDLDLFQPWPAPNWPRVVLHVTNFQPWKGSQIALEVLAQLRAGGRDWRLTVVGDGPGARPFDRRARSLGLTPHIRRCGPVEPTSELLGSSAVLLSTSRRESFGLAALEALACGVPVVAPHLPGLSETLGTGPGALQVARPTPERLASAIQAVVLDPSRRRAARARAEQFDIRRTAEAYLAPLATPGLAG